MRAGLEIVAVSLSVIGTTGSVVFYFLSAIGAVDFLRHRRKVLDQPSPSESALPPVSILKPLKGIDPGMWESFCSHCDQDYPLFQIIFGVSDPVDPAVEIVRRLQAKYPAISIELVVCEGILGANIKVSNLAQMLPSARHEILLINDSDIRVPADYLRRVAAHLADPAVGLATCLYRGVASATLGSRLEALSIGADFIPGVLTARFLEKGLHFGLGSTLALRRSDLAGIGGFESLVDHLADDYEIGRRIAASGKRIELSAAVVSTFLPAYTFSQFVSHQLRWARTIRDARHWGYAGLIFTFGLPWAALGVVATRGAAWAWALFAAAVAARFTVAALSSMVVLEETPQVADVFSLPLRDSIAPLIWAASFMGNHIQWRGQVFQLKDGRLKP